MEPHAGLGNRDHNYTIGLGLENSDSRPAADSGTSQRSSEVELFFVTLCIALTVFLWFVFHGDPRKNTLKFIYPPRPFWDVTACIFYDCITEGLATGCFPVLFCFVCMFVGEIFTTYKYSAHPTDEIGKIEQFPPPLPLKITCPSEFQVYFNAYLICAVGISFLGILTELWNLYLVQRQRFKIAMDPLQVSFVPTMGDALCSSNFKTRQSAFYDLMVLVDARESRIFDLLKLTHPGRHPFAWNTILTPITSLIGGATLHVGDFTNFIRRQNRKETFEQPSDKRNVEEVLSGIPIASEKRIGKQKYLARLRDLVSPIHTLVRFRAANNQQPYLVDQVSPVTKLIGAPSFIVDAISTRIQKTLNSIPKLPSGLNGAFAPQNPLNAKLQEILMEQNILIWATHILVAISEFSISNDCDGVISTSLSRIVPAHIEFYETLEKLLEEFKPIGNEIRRTELDKLINLLTEYKKSLVFFYVNYAPHARILRIPPHMVQRWRYICCEEINSHFRIDAASELGAPTLFTEED